MGVADGMWRQIHAGRAPSALAIQDIAEQEAEVFSLGERQELTRRLNADVLALGPLEELMTVPGLTDILVNGVGQVWIDRGEGLERSAVALGDAEAVRRLAVRLAARAGRRLDDASPFVDAVLPDGVRVHAILPPLVESAAHISLRVPSRQRLSLASLVASGSISSDLAPVLRGLVRQRVAFMISGGTGSGKTTLLGALLREVPHNERIVLVEDVRELSVSHPHVVRLEGRNPNVEGVGEVTLQMLVRQCLRMRPDRIVIGEVRGAEVRELMSALNTGHEGGCGTLHANTIADVPARFDALGALAGLSPEAVRTQLRSAINVFIHVARGGENVHGRVGRRVHSIGILRGDHRELSVEPAWIEGEPASAWPALQRLAGVS